MSGFLYFAEKSVFKFVEESALAISTGISPPSIVKPQSPSEHIADLSCRKPSHFQRFRDRDSPPNLLPNLFHYFSLFVDGFVSKHLRNLLQGLLRCLRHEEVGKDACRHAEEAKEQIRAPSDGDDHLRHNNPNDEVGNPYGSSRKTDTFASLAVVPALGRKTILD